MNKYIRVLTSVMAILLFCGLTLAQEPAVNIDKTRHANLAAAQRLIAEANKSIMLAQKDNRYDMHGNATKARELLVQASEELKAAAEAANTAAPKKK